MKVTDIVVDRDFKNFLPGHSDDELKQLVENIKAEGEIRDPLVVWKERGILLDGYTRLDAYRNGGLDVPEPSIKQLSFEDEKTAKNWMLLNQFGRRNLPPEKQSYLRGLLYESEKSDRTENLKSGTKKSKNSEKSPKDQNETSGKSTAESVAKKTHSTPTTVKRDAEFTRAVDAIGKNVGAKVKNDILNGESGISKKDVLAIGRLPNSQQAKAIRNARQGNPITPPEDATAPKSAPKTFDDKSIDDLIGKLARKFDERAKVFGKGAKHQKCLTAMNGVLAAWNDWK